LIEREKISSLVSEKTLYAKEINERIKKSLQHKNAEKGFNVYNKVPENPIKERAKETTKILEDIRATYLNKNIKNGKPEVEKYYKKYVE
jgi:hypothetical protein